MSDTIVQIETPTHGRAIVRRTGGTTPAGLLVGFHGYGETAEIQMARLAAIPGAAEWTLLSVQALHRFYRGRSEEVVASWMTRQDREAAVADNVRYVDAAIEAGADGAAAVVVAGFSQGAAMAFRAAVLGRRRPAGVIAVGGDIPPELAGDTTARFPPTLLVRGTRDEYYTQAKLQADLAALDRRRCPVQRFVFEGGHEWTPDVDAAAGRFLASLGRR